MEPFKTWEESREAVLENNRIVIWSEATFPRSRDRERNGSRGDLLGDGFQKRRRTRSRRYRQKN